MSLTSLKSRIFGHSQLEETIVKPKHEDPKFLEELLENLAHEKNETKALVIEEEKEIRKSLEKLSHQEILLEAKENRPPMLLYKLDERTFYVYKKAEEKGYSPETKEKSFDVYIPTNVVVRRVPSHILGNGVLGRAFIYSNYIEILDSLLGHEYLEVLTHEVMHIRYPEKKEMEIRQITKNYLGDKTIYH